MLKRWTPLVVLAVAGCASLGPSGAPLRQAMASGVASGDRAGAAPSIAQAAVALPRAELSEQQAMAEVAPMLADLAAADPKLHAEVLEQLAGSKPSLWSLTVQRAQQTLAYKRQLAEAKPAAVASQPDSAALPRVASSQPAAPAPAVAPLPPAATREVLLASATAETPPASGLPTVIGGTGPTPSVIQNAHVANAAPAPSIAPSPSAAAAEVRAHFPQVAAGQTFTPGASTPGSAQASAPTDWRAHLDAAIAGLADESPTPPRSGEEARERLRLQLLHLAAGDTDRAVTTPAGLSAAEQGYWSNQLYALATLLEEQHASDLRARADAAARHQGEASAKLRDMGSLQVRNFVTCREVFGFGAYEPLPDPRYAPGDQVVLYAEVDHYRSTATAEGYRTTIASSYRLLDGKGEEVASGDFPEVDDVCLALRRDFYIQYGVSLPRELANGDYRLELTVRDKLADKLGQDELTLTIGPR